MGPRFKRVSQAAVATAVALLFGSDADAGAVGGRWDPLFGPNDAGLYWSGVANFTIPDSCLTGTFTGSGSVFVSNTSGCAMNFVDATVNLTRDTSTETLVYSPADCTNCINGMEIKNVDGANAVVGISTDLIGPELAGNPLIYQGPFWIFFQPGAVDPVFGQEGTCTDFPAGCVPDPEKISDPAFLTITTICGPSTFCDYTRVFTEPGAVVPEPETMGLVLGALGAGWLARRRRKVA